MEIHWRKFRLRGVCMSSMLDPPVNPTTVSHPPIIHGEAGGIWLCGLAVHLDLKRQRVLGTGSIAPGIQHLHLHNRTAHMLTTRCDSSACADHLCCLGTEPGGSWRLALPCTQCLTTPVAACPWHVSTTKLVVATRIAFGAASWMPGGPLLTLP